MSVRLSLVQLNVEQDRHLKPVTDFLAARKPDVVCLQELLRSDIQLFEKTLDAKCFFTPMNRQVIRGSQEIQGTGIFSRLPIRRSSAEYYAGPELPDVYFDMTELETRHRTQRCALSWCDIEKEGVLFRIAATHFTWTPDGQPDTFQREDIQALIRSLEAQGELVVCGDFNASRGGEIFGLLAKHFRDNIPLEYTTSIDGALHRAGPLELMVDGIFSTQTYRVSDVEQICGLSDHCAFIASVEKV